MKLLLLYVNTIRYLKISQIFWRIFYRYYRPTLPKNLDDFRRSDISINFPLMDNSPSISWNGYAKFLNESHCIRKKIYGMTEILLTYGFITFITSMTSFLRTLLAIKRTIKSLIVRWIAENPPLDGIGWDPYPTSIRVVNIIKWLWHTNIDQENIKNNLALQCSYLLRKLSGTLEAIMF